ncbi:MAG: FixH family protein [Myxococcales bacterium]|nr:FixH family protein [Myxococcales bacterium]
MWQQSSLETVVVAVAAFGLLSCAAETGEAESMVDGRLLEAEQGTFTATFEMNAPHKGLNPLTIEVFDGEDEAVSGADMEISPWMPGHGHGSLDTVAEEDEPGVYIASEVYFNMTGYWELHVAAAVEGEIVAKFVVPVQVR